MPMAPAFLSVCLSGVNNNRGTERRQVRYGRADDGHRCDVKTCTASYSSDGTYVNPPTIVSLDGTWVRLF